jgi:hypothetical protein
MRQGQQIGALTAELEAAALAALADEFQALNAALFARRLRVPVLELADARARLGCWIGQGRRLQISRALLLERGWGAVVEVLKHEMAHQFVAEVLQRGQEPPHGPTFLEVCAQRGIDARAAGEPAVDGPPHPVLDRVAKLLALATSANEHEAHAAMSAAQRIMLRHNIEGVSRSGARGYGFRHLGTPSGRIREPERILAQILTEHFFVDAIWVRVWRALEARPGSVLEICGRPENLEIASYVHAYLLATAEQLWRQHKRAHGLRRDADRQAYLAGVMSGFRERLEQDRVHHAGAGLVWRSDPQLTRYLRQRHPYVRTIRRQSTARASAHGAGKRAGREIVLRRGVSAGAASGTAGLLPAPGRRT